jgi:hypothetical protein
MKLIEQQCLFLKDITKLINWAVEQGYIVTEGEGWRTQEQQDIYWNTGKTKVKHSRHQDRLAHDFNFFLQDGTYLTTKEQIQPIGDYWESLSPENTWGGNWQFTDVPHFQRTLT